MASMWPSTVVRFAPIVTTDRWLPPASRHAAISRGHWLSPRLYCWMDSKPNASASLPSSSSLAAILALIWIASVWLRPENRNPSPILAARSNAASLKPPSQIGIVRFGRGKIPALSIRWSESSWSTTGCSHSLRIKAICCSCRLPRRRKCPDISRPSYSTQFQPTPKPAIREQVDVRSLLGEQGRLSLRQDDHARCQSEVLGDAGEVSVGDQRLVERIVFFIGTG